MSATAQAQRELLLRDLRVHLERKIERLLRPVETGVDRYLDWHCTLLGEYQRLTALAAGKFAELMVEQMKQHLFAATDFDVRWAPMLERLQERTWQRLTLAAGFLDAQW